jgi:hypothetical protein
MVCYGPYYKGNHRFSQLLLYLQVDTRLSSEISLRPHPSTKYNPIRITLSVFGC